MSTPHTDTPATAREPLSQGRRTALVVGGIVAAGAIAWGVVAIISLLSGRTSATDQIVLTPQRSQLQVDVSSGDVTLHRGGGADVVVNRTTWSGLRSPETSEVSDPDGVRIAASCPGPFNWFCGVSYDIAVPDGFTVELVSSSGDQTVRDLTVQSLRVEASSGAVRLADVAGPVQVRTSSGDIAANGMRSDTLTVEASSGDVLLDFVAPPSRVDVEVSSGDVRIRLPDGVYRVLTETSSGDERVDVPTDPAASRTVDARTSSGDVTIERAGR